MLLEHAQQLSQVLRELKDAENSLALDSTPPLQEPGPDLVVRAERYLGALDKFEATVKRLR